jgi:hypothetical protein
VKGEEFTQVCGQIARLHSLRPTAGDKKMETKLDQWEELKEKLLFSRAYYIFHHRRETEL